MVTYRLHRCDDSANNGDNREWALCEHYGIKRAAHDNLTYAKSSDINAGGKHISVKASGFTLMAGNLCNGLEDFNAIWNLYKNTTHSNLFVYVTLDFTAYEMTLPEFEEFLFTFGRVERESAKNGGSLKIRCRKESKKMLRWLSARAIAV